MKLTEVDGSNSCIWASQPLPLSIQLPTRSVSVPPTDPWSRIKRASAGLYIWRVTRYVVLHWPEEDSGHFFTKDAYIVLKIFSPSEKSASVNYEIHAWIGRYAVQEDYITAMAKMQELHGVLNMKGMLHRQVQGRESDSFLALFNPLTVWEGSSDYSFRSTHIKRNNYSARLLMFFKPDPHLKQIIVKEVPASGADLDNTRVYILDLGDRLIQWIGQLVGTDLVLQALRYTEGMKAMRGLRTTVEVINEKGEDDENATLSRHPFYVYLSQESYCNTRTLSRGSDTANGNGVALFPSLQKPARTAPRLCKIVKAKGKVEFHEVKKGNLNKKDFEKQNFCIFDNGQLCYVWMSSKLPMNEEKEAMAHGHNYLMSRPNSCIPIISIRDGQASMSFQKALVA